MTWIDLNYSPWMNFDCFPAEMVQKCYPMRMSWWFLLQSVSEKHKVYLQSKGKCMAEEGQVMLYLHSYHIVLIWFYFLTAVASNDLFHQKIVHPHSILRFVQAFVYCLSAPNVSLIDFCGDKHSAMLAFVLLLNFFGYFCEFVCVLTYNVIRGKRNKNGLVYFAASYRTFRINNLVQ